MPVLTKYGYHLIKINDKREALGKVKVAHIMFNTGVGASKEKLNEASDKINRANELLANGEAFELVAEKFSEDRSTAVKGGVLPTFGVGKMVPKFEEVAFSLKNVGDISVPFATEFGYHIMPLFDLQLDKGVSLHLVLGYGSCAVVHCDAGWSGPFSRADIGAIA